MNAVASLDFKTFNHRLLSSGISLVAWVMELPKPTIVTCWFMMIVQSAFPNFCTDLDICDQFVRPDTASWP